MRSRNEMVLLELSPEPLRRVVSLNPARPQSLPAGAFSLEQSACSGRSIVGDEVCDRRGCLAAAGPVFSIRNKRADLSNGNVDRIINSAPEARARAQERPRDDSPLIRF